MTGQKSTISSPLLLLPIILSLIPTSLYQTHHPDPKPETRTQTRNHVVRFLDYKDSGDHRAYLESSVGGSPERWRWIERRNPALRFPTDFGVLEVRDFDAVAEIGRLDRVKDVSLDAILTRSLFVDGGKKRPGKIFTKMSFDGEEEIRNGSLSWRRKLHMEGDDDFKINWRRVATTSMFGFAFVGPVGNYWYEYLDRFIRLRLQLQPKSLKFVTTKVAADGLLFGPLDLVIFFSYMGLAAGRSLDQVKEDVKRDFLPSLLFSGAVWPLVQFANFRYVPVRYQLLYVNIFCLLDSSLLSWIEQQGDAPWKQWFKSHLSLENEKDDA